MKSFSSIMKNKDFIELFQSKSAETFDSNASLSDTVNNVDGSAIKIKRRSQAVLEVASIGEMSRLGIIAKENESRWIYRNLVSKDDFQTPMVEIRRRIHRLGIANDFVKQRRRNSS